MTGWPLPASPGSRPCSSRCSPPCCCSSPATPATRDSASPWPSQPRSTCCSASAILEPREQRPRRAAPVTDRVLLLGRELRHRQARRAVIGQERRVVAEPPLTPRLRRQPSATATLEDTLDPARRIDIRDRAHVLQRAARRRLAQEPLEVLPVGRMLARVTRRR